MSCCSSYAFVTDQVLPYVGEWFEEARIPRELARELGKLGVLGMLWTDMDAPARARPRTA